MDARSRHLVIDKFEGDYAFLSNFFPSPIPFDKNNEYNYIAPTVEHAFQATKTPNIEEAIEILKAPTPGKAKRLGRKCKLANNWETIKEEVMLDYVRLKFQIPDLKEKLLATDDAILIEGTTWHDNIWGNCSCPNCVNIEGQNKLGKILMKVRDEMKNE